MYRLLRNLALLLVAAMFFGMAYSAALKKADVEKIFGTVQQSPDDAGWENISEGDQVGSEQFIRTGGDSFCDIALDKSNRFRLKESTKIKIARLWESPSEKITGIVRLISLNLLSGEIVSRLDALPEETHYGVSTPVSVAGAKGTGFSVVYREDNQHALLSVYDHGVSLSSVANPAQSTFVNTFQSVDTAPWETASLSAEGVGVLSETILGREFVKEKLNQRILSATGQDTSPAKARRKALSGLQSMLLNLHLNEELTVGTYILQNMEKAASFYSFIESLKAVMDDNNTAAIELNIDDVESLLEIKIPSTRGPMKSLSLAEYGKMFGAKARVTTQRAAKIDAYRKLAESIYGVVINSETTIRDYATKDDLVVTTVQGIIQGARLVSTTYYSDGSVMVQLQLDGNLIPGQLEPQIGPVLGPTYMSAPVLVEFSDFEDFRNIL